jgi:membrane associated rhomboid family serine protease
MLFPIGDDDRQLHKPSYVTTTLLVLNIAVFFLLQGAGSNEVFTYGWSAIPYELTTGEDLVGGQQLVVEGTPFEVRHAPGPALIWLTAISAMFMHGGFAHLGGNLLYLWIFGDNVEHRFGHRTFLGFYLISGLAATAAQVALDPGSIIPTLGASGAISGVMGAYLVLFPRNNVHALLLFWLIRIPAVVAIGAWIVLQFVSGWSQLVGPGASTGGVAYAAHIGGFLAGALMAMVLRKWIREERPTAFAAAAQRRNVPY